MKESATSQLGAQKDRATDGLGSVARAVRHSTQQLREQRHETIAQYVDQAAEHLERFAGRLKEQNVGDLGRQAQDLARRQPGLFIASAFALGVIGARFLKSSRSHADRNSAYGWRPETSPGSAGRF